MPLFLWLLFIDRSIFPKILLNFLVRVSVQTKSYQQFSGWKNYALRKDSLESVVCYSYLISSQRLGNLAALIASCLSVVLWPMTYQTFHVERHQHAANIADWDLNHVCCAMGKEKQRDLLSCSYITMRWTNMHLACITIRKSTELQASHFSKSKM